MIVSSIGPAASTLQQRVLSKQMDFWDSGAHLQCVGRANQGRSGLPVSLVHRVLAEGIGILISPYFRWNLFSIDTLSKNFGAWLLSTTAKRIYLTDLQIN